MNWFIFAAIAGLASNGFNITNRTALKDQGDSTAYAWWFEVIRSGFFLIVGFITKVITISQSNILPLIYVSLAEMFSVYVFMKMHALTHLSLSSIISRLRVIWTPILALFIVGEHLTRPEYMGIVAIFIGVAIVTSPKELKSDKGVIVALIFSFSSGLLSSVTKYATQFTNTDTIIFTQGLIPILLFPIIMKDGAKRIVGSLKSRFPQIGLAGSFNILSSYLLLQAYRFTDASKAVAVYQAMTVLAVLYGIFVLKENNKVVSKIIGTIAVIIGVILTAG